MEGLMAVVISGAIAALFIALGLPLAYRKIPPNRWYGYRVSRYQFEDDEIWYAINRKGGVHLVFAGAACLVVTAVSILFTGNPDAQLVIMVILTALLMAFIAYEITWSVRAARRLARDKGLAKGDGADSD
ncbi:MAG: SdpI family protein [Actinobacteria bacterium]|jgi:predicted MFS family arabinose efflux permease|nr:MAG: SdpI family protein [Actinomycetota bacterium]